jgi:hypothetical protein
VSIAFLWIDQTQANWPSSTVVIFIILLVFMFKVMASSSVPVLGSPGALWDLLQPDVLTTQAYGAKDGSYLTMDSGGTSFKTGV